MTHPSPIRVVVGGIGVLGPGLADWRQAAPILVDPAELRSEQTRVTPPARLPPTERRRAGVVVKAALVVADEACAAAGIDASGVATVFSSSTGDPLNCHLLCEALATPERIVSPTRFTNSVHNAPAGYWHIAAQSRRPSTSLAAFDASFGAGLLEAAVQCVAAGEPVLFVACDAPYPEPLHSLRSVADVFAVALLLLPVSASTTGRQLSLDGAPRGCAPTKCSDPALEALRGAIPAAQALPLLCALAAASGAAEIAIADVADTVRIWRLET